MSNTKIYAYAITKPFNFERLHREIKSSPILQLLEAPKNFMDKVQVEFSESLSVEDEVILNEIIENHSGQVSRTSIELQNKRELVLSELVDMAHNHPVLKNDSDVITEYLTSIDNWFNSWKRDGNHNKIVAKIVEDSQDTNHPNHGFLNTVVRSDGALTYQFLISYIPTTPYI